LLKEGQNKRTEQAELKAIDSAGEEELLVKRARSGNMAAFGQLIEKYQDRLFNAILRMVGNYDDSQELTQEAFFRALRGLNRFGGKSGFYTWLFRIGMNLSINHCQHRSRLQFTSLNAGGGNQADGLLAVLADKNNPRPDRQAQMQEEHQRTLAALANLEAAARAVVVLRDIEGLDYGQIARILEVPVGTVKSRLSRAREELRKQLFEE